MALSTDVKEVMKSCVEKVQVFKPTVDPHYEVIDGVQELICDQELVELAGEFVGALDTCKTLEDFDEAAPFVFSFFKAHKCIKFYVIGLKKWSNAFKRYRNVGGFKNGEEMLQHLKNMGL